MVGFVSLGRRSGRGGKGKGEDTLGAGTSEKNYLAAWSLLVCSYIGKLLRYHNLPR